MLANAADVRAPGENSLVCRCLSKGSLRRSSNAHARNLDPMQSFLIKQSRRFAISHADTQGNVFGICRLEQASLPPLCSPRRFIVSRSPHSTLTNPYSFTVKVRPDISPSKSLPLEALYALPVIMGSRAGFVLYGTVRSGTQLGNEVCRFSPPPRQMELTFFLYLVIYSVVLR